MDSGPKDALIVLTPKDLDTLCRDARAMVRDPKKLEGYAVNEFAEQTLLLGETAKKLLKDAGMSDKPMNAAKLATAGAKLHGEWREMMLPMIKRLLKAAEKGGLSDNGG